ncbi:MAG: hypothetical protein ACRYG5_14770 [Janthinobacterium lividum]
MDNKPHPRDWQSIKRDIDQEIEKIWLTEPLELKRVRYGIIDSGAGSGKQVFSVLVHLEGYLMVLSQDVFFRFLKVAQYEDVSVDLLARMTNEFTNKTFDIFEFLDDLGLVKLGHLGHEYLAAIATLSSKEDYVALTSSLTRYIVRLQRWVHLYFPWNLGVAFPHRTESDYASLSRTD